MSRLKAVSPMMLVAVAVAGVGLWAMTQHREMVRQEEARRIAQKQEQEQEQEQKRKDSDALAAAAKAAETAKANRAAIVTASDDALKALVKDCQRKVEQQITSKANPAFAVYFPSYSANDLERLSSLGFAMNSATGRPSVSLNRDNFEEEQISVVRQIPSEISIVAESASDSFSGVKRWAAEYRCYLEGLYIRSVERRGALHFF